jgi:hypothetical protein
VIKPVELTEATVELELDHVTSGAGEPPILADACTEVPDAMGLVGTVITRDELGSDVELPPPHAARASEKPARIPETHRIGRVSPDAVPGRLRCEVSGSTLHYTEAGASFAAGEASGGNAWNWRSASTRRQSSSLWLDQGVLVMPSEPGATAPRSSPDGCDISLQAPERRAFRTGRLVPDRANDPALIVDASGPGRSEAG